MAIAVEDLVLSCTNTLRRCLKFVIVAAVLGMAGETSAQLGSRPNYGNRLGTQWRHETSFLPQGVQVALNSIDPAVRKWYVPEELFAEYRWRQWQTTNYARADFERYVAPEIEGGYLYDMFGMQYPRGGSSTTRARTRPRNSATGSSREIASKGGSAKSWSRPTQKRHVLRADDVQQPAGRPLRR